MKSQDILVLFKLVTVEHASADQQRMWAEEQSVVLSKDWKAWNDVLSDDGEVDSESVYAYSLTEKGSDPLSIRALEAALGLSKSEISQSLKRSMAVGLAIRSRRTGKPQANKQALTEFIQHGLRYVFPAEPGAMVRGIATGVDAPVFNQMLARGGEYGFVWPDPQGTVQGQAIAPLYRSVPHAVRRDRELYALLALSDAIRLGRPREYKLASEMLGKLLNGR